MEDLPDSKKYTDLQFQEMSATLSEINHCYGKNIHILSDLFLLSHLSKLCAENTVQPVINELISTLYSSILKIVVNREFPSIPTTTRTRMVTLHPKEGIMCHPAIDPDTPVVSVNLARAGTFPSHVCYTSLNYFMSPSKVRQDHISIGRTMDAADKVIGSKLSGYKIGGQVQGAIVLFPDPMGATGGTLTRVIDLYKQHGTALKYIALHCIITPEYIKSIKNHHPDLIVYAVRLDRGLSPTRVLHSIPGTYWEEEKGLNDKQYIVPGGGGFGEIMNNAYI